MTTLIGYARVSTQDQNLQSQVDALESAGCKKIYTDKASGATAARPGLGDVLEHLREGETLVVYKLDRLGRSLRDLIEIINGLKERGIGFKSLGEAFIDTTGSEGWMIFQIFGTFAEYELNVNHERTMKGLAAARAQGRTGGRKLKLSPQKQKLLYELYAATPRKPIMEICGLLGISKKTLYAYLRRRNQEAT